MASTSTEAEQQDASEQREASEQPTWSNVYQFKITLKESFPPIWRQIQVPEYYTFSNLHSAIQNSMGWADCHMHHFTMKNKAGKQILIAPPKDEEDAEDFHGFWEIAELMDSKILRPIEVEETEAKITDYFKAPKNKVTYLYDMGDGWAHDVVLEKILPKELNTDYPKCIDGKRACPPEDSGGVVGYDRLLEILADPNHKEHKDRVEWLEEVSGIKNFDPEEFDPKKVKFYSGCCIQ